MRTFICRTILAASVSAFALPGALHMAAAQGADGADADDETARLATVVVNARKREEAIIDAPVSVSAISADQLVLEEIDNIADIVERVPGVDFAGVGAPFADQISVRGQGQGRQINAESQTGLYRNGSFIAGGNIGGNTLSRMDLFDVETVEAYRGPQGASYGRNALGGAINIVSRAPRDEFGGRVSIEYGTNERIEAEGVINVPLSDAVKSRFGIYIVEQSDGFYYNEFLDNVPDQEDFVGLRGSLLIEPSDTLDILLTADYFDEETPSFAHRATRPEPGVDVFTRSFNIDSRFNREEVFLQAEINKDLDFATLTSLSYYKHRDAATIDDLDAQQGNNFGAGQPFPPNPAGNTRRDAQDDFTRYGTELRLASNSEGPLSWVVGGEVLVLEDDYMQQFSGFAGPLAGVNTLVMSSSEDLNYALFALLGYDITDQVNLTGELRYSVDDKEVDIDSTRGVAPMTVNETFNFSDEFENFAPVVTLSWEPSDTLTTYLRYATGFRAGGFNLTPDPVPPADFSLTYDPEEAENFEIGVKSTLFDGNASIAVALYHVLGTDVLLNDQLTVGTFPASRNINFVKNGPDTETTGLEIDGFANFDLPGEAGDLRINATAAWADGEFTNTVPFISAAGSDLTGQPVPFLRDFSGSLGTTYSIDLTDDWAFRVTHSFRYQTGGFDGIASDMDGNFTQTREDLELHDLRLLLTDGRYRATLAVENLFDEDYFFNQTPQGVVSPGDPQTVSLELALRF